MSKKVYTLELTAEELDECSFFVPASKGEAMADKLKPLREQARRDRKADELRLPWRVRREDCQNFKTWTVMDGRENLGWGTAGQYTQAQVKLMSAAPELLEAVQAMAAAGVVDRGDRRWIYYDGIGHDIGTLVSRALRKVETGVPE